VSRDDALAGAEDVKQARRRGVRTILIGGDVAVDGVRPNIPAVGQVLVRQDLAICIARTSVLITRRRSGAGPKGQAQ